MKKLELLEKTNLFLDLNFDSERTKEGYKNAINKFLKENNTPSHLSKSDIQLYFSKFRNKYSNSYYNVLGSALIILYRYVLNQPFKMNWFKSIKLERKYYDIVSNDQFIFMMKSVNNIKHKFIIILLYSTGIRETEAINLKLSDINFKEKTIFIRSLKHGKNRHVLLHELTEKYLKSYLKKWNPKYYLLEGQNGSKYSASSIRNIFKKSSNNTVYPHLMRHTFITKTIENEDIFATMELAGHKNPNSTLHYNHIAKDRLQRMYNPLDTIKNYE